LGWGRLLFVGPMVIAGLNPIFFETQMKFKIKTSKVLDNLFNEIREDRSNYYSLKGDEAAYECLDSNFGPTGMRATIENIVKAKENGQDVYDVRGTFFVGKHSEIKKKFLDLKETLKTEFEKEKKKIKEVEDLNDLVKKAADVDLSIIYGEELLKLLMDEKKIELVVRALKNRAFG